MSFASRLAKEPELTEGALQTENLSARWSSDSLTLELKGERHTLAEGGLGALQISRGVRAAPSGWWDHALWRDSAEQHLALFELRAPGAPRLRLAAEAEAAWLEGLPWSGVGPEHIHVERSELIAFTDACRALGADVASWPEEATARPGGAIANQPLRVPWDAPRLRLIWPGVLLALLILPLPSGWVRLEPLPWTLGAMALFLGAAFLAWRSGAVLRSEPEPALDVYRGRPLRWRSRSMPLKEARAVVWKVERSSSSIEDTVHIGLTDVVVVTPEGDAPVWLGARDRETAHAMAERIGGRLGVEVFEARDARAIAEHLGVSRTTVAERFDRPSRARLSGRQGVLWAVACVLVLLLGGWLSTQSSASPHQVAQLGGWFTGHGSLIASITGTFTEDYSLIDNPTRIRHLAISPTAERALTCGDDTCALWDVSGGEELMEIDAERDAAVVFSEERALVIQRGRVNHLDKGTIRGSGLDLPLDLPPLSTNARNVACFSGDHQYLYRSGQLFDLQSGQDGLISADSDGSDHVVRFSPTCEVFMMRPRYGTTPVVAVTLENTQLHTLTADSLPFLEPSDRGLAVDFDPRSKRFAVAHKRSIHLFDTTGATLKTLDDVLPLPTGDRYSDPMLRWRPAHPNQVLVTSAERAAGINASPGVVFVVDVGTGEVLAELRGHGDEIVALDLNLTGSHAITGSRDQSARVWLLP